MSAYHAVELAITTLAVAGSGAYVLRGWVMRLAGRRRRAAAAGCSSCNDCGSCGPAPTAPAALKEAPIKFVRRPGA